MQYVLNSLWPSDAIHVDLGHPGWWHRSRSTLVQVTACCLKTRSLTWNNGDLSSIGCFGIYTRAVSREDLRMSIRRMGWKTSHLKSFAKSHRPMIKMWSWFCSLCCDCVFSSWRIHVKYFTTFYRIFYDDVIKWTYFLRYWPFVREIHRSPVNFPHRGQWCGALVFLWSASE